MTREEEIKLTADKYCLDEYTRLGFVAGAQWADAHPHWISVEDEMPMEYEEVLAIANVDGNIVPFVGVCENGMFYFIEPTIRKERRVTHWMPLPQPPKKGGEE